jgi:hypothetical protein
MNADDLRELAAAFKLSPKAAELVIADLLQREPNRMEYGAPGKKPLFQVESVGGQPTFNRPKPEPLEMVAELLAMSGCGRDVHKLRKLHERQAVPDPRYQVPSEPWVVMAEAESTSNPDIQAQACLRLMQPWTELNSRPWVRDLARRRLVHLLVEFPALMHPRIVFDFENQHLGRLGESLPMANAIAATAHAAFPSPLHGITEQQMKDFATHPVVGYALRSAAPVLDGRNTRGSAPKLQGKTLMGHMLGGTSARLATAHSLLLIERLRNEARGGTAIFSGTETARSGITHVLALAFRALWARRAEIATETGQAFIAEYARSPVHRPEAKALAYDAVHLLFDTVKSNMAAAPDQFDRYERLVDCLQRVGVCGTEHDAAREVMKALFPASGENGRASTAPSYADVNLANTLLSKWREAGVSLDELNARVWRTHGHSSWGTALEVMDNLQVMRDVIAAHPVAPVQAAESGESAVAIATPERRAARRAL